MNMPNDMARKTNRRRNGIGTSALPWALGRHPGGREAWRRQSRSMRHHSSFYSGGGEALELVARETPSGPERHVRLLAPLAFVSPRIVAAILDGTAPEQTARPGRADYRRFSKICYRCKFATWTAAVR
jgi:hypothetical protein